MRRRISIAAMVVLSVLSLAVVAANMPSRVDAATTTIRAAVYYQWFPEAEGWATRYHPTLGKYDSSNQTVLAAHVGMAKYAGLDAFIASWWGVGSPTDTRLPLLLDAAQAQDFKVAPYYEPAGKATQPTDAALTADLDRLAALSVSPAWLRVNGKPVLFVYNASTSGGTCAAVARYVAAASTRFYVQAKVFSGYRTCPTQPDSWHQYGPATHSSNQTPYSYTVSPGFFKFNEAAPRLVRDVARFTADLSTAKASGAQWQLVTTFNEWGEGTSVEPATEWQTSSGYGAYLDAMRQVFLGLPPTTPTPTITPTRSDTPTPSETPSETATPSDSPTPTPTSESPTPSPSVADVVVAAAGDIACKPGSTVSTSSCHHKDVSDKIVAANPDAVLTLGDNQYESNSYAEYTATGTYASTWGRLLTKTRPAIGNHEYLTSGAAGYFQYFGAAAGDPKKGYYSYDLGAWHFLSLNSECSSIGGCAAENTWIQADLAAHPTMCTLAYWHEPRFSAGQHGDAHQTDTIWNTLAAAKVDVALWGHNHNYERFDPAGVTPAGALNPVLDPAGIRAWVVGTGGKNHYAVTSSPLTGEKVINADTFGYLKLTLHPTGYDWQFIPETGKTFTDTGSGDCH